MPEAGWYPDPHDPRQQRYWNGSTWTEHVHVPETSAAQGRPPFVPPPSAGQSVARTAPGQVNDIGEWLRSSFRVAGRRLGVCFMLTLLGLVPLLVVGALVLLALYDLDIVGDEVTGFGGADLALLAAAGVVALGSLIWFGVITIAQYRVLYDAHRVHSTTIGEALAVGRRNIGRLIVAYLIVYAVAILVLVLIAGVSVAVGVGSSSSSEELVDRALPIYNLFSALSWPVSMWLSVKLAFIPVAAAVAPRGDGLLRISWQASRDRFWAVLGRILLLSIVTAAVFIPLMILLMIVVGVGALSLGSGDGAAIGGVIIGGVLFGLLFVGAIYFAQIFQASALSRLYADLGAPVAE